MKLENNMGILMNHAQRKCFLSNSIGDCSNQAGSPRCNGMYLISSWPGVKMRYFGISYFTGGFHIVNGGYHQSSSIDFKDFPQKDHPASLEYHHLWKSPYPQVAGYISIFPSTNSTHFKLPEIAGFHEIPKARSSTMLNHS